jgi:diguanylate cyclase (GGDEF)-like protein/PAS domain S-box-containing protein
VKPQIQVIIKKRIIGSKGLELSTLAFVVIGLLLLAIAAAAVFYFFYFLRDNDSDEQRTLCLQKALGVVSEAVVIVNKAGMIQHVNQVAENLLKYEKRSLLGRNFWNMYSLLDANTQRPVVGILDDLNRQASKEYLLVLPHQQELSVNLVTTPINFLSSDINESSFALVFRDISEEKILQSKLAYLETYDALTRLPNLKAIETHIKLALTDAKKHNARHVFCYISLDQFKYITDSVGHAAGDTMISQVAEELRDCIKSERDILARLGVDEFGILYREKEPTPALQMIEHVRKRIEKFKFRRDGEEHQVTASIGFVLLHSKSTGATQILSDADIASRVARQKGGNRVFIFRPDDEDVSQRKGNVKWVSRLKHAVESNMFRLFAQPIHPLAVDKFSAPFFHYETLIRLYDEEGNQIPPDEFLPAAEQHGMMMQIDKWVLNEALHQLQKITQKKPLPVFSINLSGQSINEPKFKDYVIAEIKKAGIRPQMICFEITETVAIGDLNLALRFITALKSLGCSFSLDDFGTGVSSYGYLKKLPVDYLKIDGSFVKDLVTDPVSQAMVRSINQVGHVMNLQVIAEYVENNQIIQMLNEIGVDYGQGYGISRPEPIEDAIRRHRL